MIQGLSHLTFMVKDLERMSQILIDIFDAEEVYDSGEITFSRSREKFFRIGSIWIAIMEGDSLSETTYNHVAFKISDDEFEAYLMRVSNWGLKMKAPRSRVEGEGRSIYFYDEDGHLFELHTGTLEERLRRYKGACKRNMGGEPVKPYERRIIFRGTELYHFVNALKEKGAVSLETNTLLIDDLLITVTELGKYQLGSLSLTEVELLFTGNEASVCSLSEQIRKDFMTAGG